MATLFHNSDVDAKAAEALAGRITDEYPHLELEVHAGAPELYSYLMVLE